MTMAFVPFPYGLDQWMHVSFVRWEEAHPELFPRYEAMRVLSIDLGHWTKYQTWLTHPSLYYLLMAPLDLATRSTLALRLANLALAAVALALMLAGGFRELGGSAERAVFAATLVAFPKLAIVAGMVNNDNLALVASGVGFYAMTLARAGRTRPILLALAFALAGWSKLTALIFLGFGVGFAELLSGRRPGREHVVPVLGVVIGLIPTAVNFSRYGAALWNSPALAVPLADRVQLTPLSYTAIFFRGMAMSWAALQPSNVLALGGLALVLGLGAWACVVGRRHWPLAVGFALAIIPSLALHLWMGWRLYADLGYAQAAQARYYYVLWPGVALALAQLWGASRGLLRAGATTATAIGLIAASAPFCIGLATLGHSAFR
jgi:hypothetical protein